jgi:hypothetical protein
LTVIRDGHPAYSLARWPIERVPERDLVAVTRRWWPNVTVKGAFIGFLPITRAFAKLLSVGWRSAGSSLVPGELRNPSGPGTEGDVLAPEPSQLSMETLVRSERTPSERSVGPLSRFTRFQLLEGARAPRRLGWELRRCACGSEKGGPDGYPTASVDDVCR